VVLTPGGPACQGLSGVLPFGTGRPPFIALCAVVDTGDFSNVRAVEGVVYVDAYRVGRVGDGLTDSSV